MEVQILAVLLSSLPMWYDLSTLGAPINIVVLTALGRCEISLDLPVEHYECYGRWIDGLRVFSPVEKRRYLSCLVTRCDGVPGEHSLLSIRDLEHRENVFGVARLLSRPWLRNSPDEVVCCLYFSIVHFNEFLGVGQANTLLRPIPPHLRVSRHRLSKPSNFGASRARARLVATAPFALSGSA
jgi:hypothetical protein